VHTESAETRQPVSQSHDQALPRSASVIKLAELIGRELAFQAFSKLDSEDAPKQVTGVLGAEINP